ncbi:chymotrypsin-1-like [Octopus sinensis]|uniref:Chymotrypsin-1-like n=1 Tax=Octopus sinensis TaxID=2607531 RepID=A0A6P7TI35_9MOLL|nr:chymotrypsin-1-like [Octopus sinensis]
MLSLYCLLVTVASVFAAPRRRVGGGSPAHNCEFPSIVHLQIFDHLSDNKISLCGGILIDSTHVLTATHCVKANVRKVKVNIGSNNKWSLGSQSTTASRILKHVGYVHTPYLIKNDIAILTLTHQVNETRCVRYAQLARKGEKFGTRRCIAAGWGHFKRKGKSPNHLHKVSLHAIPHKVCKRKSKMEISDGVLCAGDFKRGGPSTCQGDSGGPLFCPNSKRRMVLAGVTSYGNKCDNEASVFSDVGYFRDWIESHL